MNKYRAKKTEVDGIRFDSKHEATRFLELRYLQQTGQIRDLKLQVPFELLPSQKVGNVTERSVKYVADFVYTDRSGNLVVEDAKGVRTDAYKLKRKMLLYFHGLAIKEV